MAKFHGAPERFEEVSQFVFEYYGRSVKYIADVAGGQGMLSRILKKKYNYEPEVIDPREYQLRGVKGRVAYYTSDMADFYDLVIGLHPDQALRPVVESAKTTNVLVVPCCNFWDTSRKIGRDLMIEEISKYFDENKIKYDRIEFKFDSPYRIGLATIFKKVKPPYKITGKD